ncbi:MULTISPECIES: hypothetical protein [unclassified Sporosarcina]|uniref:hypothetical protein n=1 Tax=unclassified Sporosarcina TaxID=2647733 RepID=UPI0020418221|nr:MULTISPECIES: hypothetical protein [unclassified Sporosarcina]GKV64076.1 hypothetical protein NCCP2331_02290 [Sporosarcina sp. NCCP-2331]GLB56349.1 hypothetical protein NCCP2378_21360 [Sporosarcina sp. NCCP-2378]
MIIKAIMKFILKVIGFLLVILGQGLILLATVSGCLMNVITGFLFFLAIISSFLDGPISYKIVFWILAIIAGAISTNIYTIPERLVNMGGRLINYDFN